MAALLIFLPLIFLIVLNLPFPTLRRFAFRFAVIAALYQILWVVFYSSVFRHMPQDLLISMNLKVDNLSLVLLLTIGIVMPVAALVARSSINDPVRRFDFFNLSLIALIGMNGTVITSDIFSLYVFMEVTAISMFILISLEKGKLALEGAFKYLILSAIATVLILTSIALIIFVAGDTSFASVLSAVENSGSSPFLKLAVILFICGLFIKSGVVPFHGWLPDAYAAAPTAVSVFLAGIVTKVTGVYVLIRLVVSVFGLVPATQNIIMFIGAISIIIGAFAALGQSDFKRMLAYSSISQVGYMILALGCGTGLALAGAIFHLFNHAIFKSLLFVNAAAVEKQLGTVNMNKMGGLSARMPVTGATSVFGLLSTAGIPPFSGFWSKVIIIIALWNSARYGYAVLALLASIVTLAYFLSMQRRVFFGKIKDGLENINEVEFGLLAPQLILAFITIGVGILFPIILNSFILPAASILR
ncbi:MAG: proton-conducting transporter membrane subunit [Candidatus Omnitrophica bacterium]|nr:proton-conducting transporter membrane subunit [Candidatus Omnitrophota bacterium]